MFSQTHPLALRFLPPARLFIFSPPAPDGTVGPGRAGAAIPVPPSPHLHRAPPATQGLPGGGEAAPRPTPAASLPPAGPPHPPHARHALLGSRVDPSPLQVASTLFPDGGRRGGSLAPMAAAAPPPRGMQAAGRRRALPPLLRGRAEPGCP